MRELFHVQKLCGSVELTKNNIPQPRPGCHVGDRVLLPAHIWPPAREVLVQHVEQPFRLHGVSVDGVLDLDWSVVVKVSEAPADEGGAAHLPHEPRLALRPRRILLGEKLAILVKLVCQVHQDRARFEYPCRFFWIRIIHHGRNLRIRVNSMEAGGELWTVDVNQPRVVFEIVEQLHELLEQNGYLDAIRRTHRIQLQRVFTLR
mmetsp:Transcript_79226/g.220257  ORF Transcript_79226/g.220257 Transcript_79226/m.220257 type:complete len:204 (-) Transcript_79226:54-665(-)